MDHPTQHRPASPDPKSSGVNRSTILVVTAAVAIVALPLLCIGLPVEIAKWYLADALVKIEAADYDAASHSLEQAASYAPTDASVYLIQAQAFRAFEKYEKSLAAAQRALELSPGSREAHRQRGATLMQTMQFAEAAEAFEAALGTDDSPPTGGGDDPLNTLAYARALAGEKLAAALEEINRALDRNADSPPMSRAAMLDTRGFILFKQGEYKQALADIDEAIDLADLRRTRHQIESVQASRPGIDLDAIMQQSRTNLAVMLYHRALVHEALENEKQAQADFDKVRELGEEPSEKLF